MAARIPPQAVDYAGRIPANVPEALPTEFEAVVTLATIANQDNLAAMTVELDTVTIGGVAKTPSAEAFRVNGATTGLVDPTDPGGTTFTPNRGGEYTFGGTVAIDGVVYPITTQTVAVGQYMPGGWRVALVDDDLSGSDVADAIASTPLVTDGGLSITCGSAGGTIARASNVVTVTPGGVYTYLWVPDPDDLAGEAYDPTRGAIYACKVTASGQVSSGFINLELHSGGDPTSLTAAREPRCLGQVVDVTGTQTMRANGSRLSADPQTLATDNSAREFWLLVERRGRGGVRGGVLAATDLDLSSVLWGSWSSEEWGSSSDDDFDAGVFIASTATVAFTVDRLMGWVAG